MLKPIVKSTCLLAAILLGGSLAMAQSSEIPNGLEKKGYVILTPCECLAVEVNQSVFFHAEQLAFDATLRDAVSTLTTSGSMTCTDPDPGESDLSLRFVLFMLGGVHPSHQEFCRS